MSGTSTPAAHNCTKCLCESSKFSKPIIHFVIFIASKKNINLKYLEVKKYNRNGYLPSQFTSRNHNENLHTPPRCLLYLFPCCVVFVICFCCLNIFFSVGLSSSLLLGTKAPQLMKYSRDHCYCLACACLTSHKHLFSQQHILFDLK